MAQEYDHSTIKVHVQEADIAQTQSITKYLRDAIVQYRPHSWADESPEESPLDGVEIEITVRPAGAARYGKAYTEMLVTHMKGNEREAKKIRAQAISFVVDALKHLDTLERHRQEILAARAGVNILKAVLHRYQRQVAFVEQSIVAVREGVASLMSVHGMEFPQDLTGDFLSAIHVCQAPHRDTTMRLALITLQRQFARGDLSVRDFITKVRVISP